MIKYFNNIVYGVQSFITGMKLTWKHFANKKELVSTLQYPHEKWPIGTKDSYTFPLVFSGSKFLIKEFPNSEDYLDDTKNKIEDI